MVKLDLPGSFSVIGCDSKVVFDKIKGFYVTK